MADILHDFFVAASSREVYSAISTGPGLDQWWTKRSSGEPVKGKEYTLWFGPEYDWRARVVQVIPERAFELEMTQADDDWIGTRIRFELEGRVEGTQVRFAHTGWAEASGHFRVSSFCWAMYLRIMKRFVELGESVGYEQRNIA